MKNTADLLDKIKSASEYGIMGADKARIDMKALLARQHKVVSLLGKGIEGQLASAGVKRIFGEGLFGKGGKLQVIDPSGKTEEVSWDKVLLAIGSLPAELPDLQFDGKSILSSTDLLTIESLPESLLIVGGGVVGCEFAFIFNALGSHVTIIESLDRLLPIPGIDKEISKTLFRQMKKKGISLHLGQRVESAKFIDGTVEVLHCQSRNGGSAKALLNQTSAERVLVSVGRQPNSEGLGAGYLGVETRKGWIAVDKYLQTANPDVFAIGDILGPYRPMLAHVAAREGVIAAGNILGRKKAMDYRVVPSVIFSQPEIGCAGMTEHEAQEAGYSIKVGKVQFRANGKAHVIDAIDGMVKLVAEEGSGKILGVHIIGPHASELIAEGVMAVQQGLRMGQLADVIHAHPTLAESLMDVAVL